MTDMQLDLGTRKTEMTQNVEEKQMNYGKKMVFCSYGWLWDVTFTLHYSDSR